jgi:hypothetical protein
MNLNIDVVNLEQAKQMLKAVLAVETLHRFWVPSDLDHMRFQSLWKP